MGFSTEDEAQSYMSRFGQTNSRLQDLTQSSPVHFRQLYSLSAIVDPAVLESPINARLVLSRPSIVTLQSESLDSVEVT